MRFQNKKVLVTGCASGIGLAQCQAFLEEGADVIGFDINDCELNHPHFRFYQVDVSQPSLVNEFDFDVDILCNTAGRLDEFKPSLETSYAEWNEIMQSNVTSMFVMCNAVLPAMLRRQNGIIINMASIASLIPGGGGASYTASKHAILGYTKQLAYDYAHQGIRVNAIAPGAIDTPMNAADFAGDGEIARAVAEQIPQKRYAKPEEVADLTLFLASDEARYICGDIIPIDGGWINRNC